MLLPCCCGVDVHDEMIEACILVGDDMEPEILRRQFKTFPNDLIAFANWLNEHECFHVAMESTGIYWRPVHKAIEKHCMRPTSVIVTNAQHMHNVPGRKADDDDAEWIATLLRHGLLSPSFIPSQDITLLRDMSRLYKSCVSERSRYINRIHKFISAHGIKLSSVLSDILCVTGRNVLNLLASKGSLSARDVASCMRGKPKHTAEEIHLAIRATLSHAECRFLSILLDDYDRACKSIDQIISLMGDTAAPYRRQLEILDSIPGIDVISSLLILAEISASPHASFSSSAKLCNWAGLSPRNDQSAGKIKSRKILHGNPYVKSILCQAAWVATKSLPNFFRSWFWDNQVRLGRKKAIIAVARKMLRVIYALLRDDVFFEY